MLEHLDTLAQTAATAISNVKFDKIVVWDGGGSGTGATAGFLQNMGRTLPPMMNVLRDIAGVELPSYLGTLGRDAENGAPVDGPLAAGSPPDAPPASAPDGAYPAPRA